MIHAFARLRSATVIFVFTMSALAGTWFLFQTKEQLAELKRQMYLLEGERLELAQKIAVLEMQRDGLAGGGDPEIYLKSNSVGQATATIQSLISTLATTNGVALRSVAPRPARQVSFEDAVGLRFEGEANYQSFIEFVEALEFNEPQLLVESATIRRLNRPGGRGQVYPAVYFQVDIFAPLAMQQGATK